MTQSAPTPAPVQAHTLAPRRRLGGVDLARAVAIIGMIAVHIGPSDHSGVGGRIYAVSWGRASILFVLVAGMGVALLAASTNRTPHQVRTALIWRSLLLLPLGLVLQELDHGVAVILQVYAVLFVVALLSIGLADRWLLGLAGASALLGPLVFLWGRAVAPESFAGATTTLTDPPAETLQGLLLSGTYPVITWAAPFLFGMWLGRRDLSSVRTRHWLVAGGATTVVVTGLASAGLQALFGVPTEPGDLARLASTGAHSQMPLWILNSTGIALVVLGSALMLAERAPRICWPLVATGQLALTIYVMHLFVLHAAYWSVTSRSPGGAALLLVAWTVVIVTVSTLWRRRFRFGPFEALLRPPSTTPSLLGRVGRSSD